MDKVEEQLIRTQLAKNIKRVIDAIETHQKAVDPISLRPESAVNTAFYEMVKMSIESFNPVAADWLDWFIWENDFGKHGLDAGYDGKTHPIRNTNDLIELIIKGMTP